MTKEKYFYFGKIIKPHGYKGYLTVRFDVSNYLDYIEDLKNPSTITPFFIEDNEVFQPYFVDNLEDKNKGHFKLKFEDIDTESDANYLRGKDIYYPLEKEIEDDAQEEMDSWVGFMVVDQANTKLGLVNEVIDFSGNLLLQIDYNQEEVLIPFNDEMIINIDESQKEIVMDIPEGLIEMNK